MSDTDARLRLVEYQAECWMIYGEKRWDAVLSGVDRATRVYRDLSDPCPSDQLIYAEVCRVGCMAGLKLDLEQFGKRGERAWGALDGLLDWLRRSDEPLLRGAYAQRLMDKVRWLGIDESALTVADEVLTVLEELDGAHVVVDVALAFLRDISWLAWRDPADQEMLAESAIEAIRRGDSANPPVVAGLSAAGVRRDELLLGLLDRLADLLQAAEGESARELLGWTLVEMMGVAAALGNAEVAQQCFGGLVWLGDDGIAGFEWMFRRDMELSGKNEPSDNVAGKIIVHAQILEALGRHDEARSRFSYFIERFQSREEPYLAVMVDLARSELAALPRGD